MVPLDNATPFIFCFEALKLSFLSSHQIPETHTLISKSQWKNLCEQLDISTEELIKQK